MVCDSAVEFLGTNKDVFRGVCSRMLSPSCLYKGKKNNWRQLKRLTVGEAKSTGATRSREAQAAGTRLPEVTCPPEQMSPDIHIIM